MTDTTNTLPPLPEPRFLGVKRGGLLIEDGWAADQMLAYGDARAAHAVAPLQARIDALMLEYCPDEMTPEQMSEWEKHQKVSDVVVPVKAGEVTDAEIDAMLFHELGNSLRTHGRRDLHQIVRAAIALANGRGE